MYLQEITIWILDFISTGFYIPFFLYNLFIFYSKFNKNRTKNCPTRLSYDTFTISKKFFFDIIENVYKSFLQRFSVTNFREIFFSFFVNEMSVCETRVREVLGGFVIFKKIPNIITVQVVPFRKQGLMF